MLRVSLTRFFQNPSLPAQVLTNLVFDYYLLFLPVILFEYFQGRAMTAVGYAFIYGSSALILHSKTLSSHLPGYAAIIALSSLTALIHPALYGYCLILSAMLGLTVRDSQQSVYHSRLSVVSYGPRMFSVLTILSVLLIPVLTNSLNIALSFGVKGDIGSSMAVQILLSLLLMILLLREPRAPRGSVTSTSPLPDKARLISWYSMLYNATSFPVRMIITPLIIYGATQEMGYSDKALSITGSIIGLVAILATLLRFLIPASSIDSVLLMTRYHRLGIFAMMGIVSMALGIELNAWSPKAMPWVIATVVFLQLSLEVSAKVWSVGFIGTLRTLTEARPGLPSTFQAAYLHFMSMKNFGSCFGFVLFAASTWLFSGPYNTFLTGMVAIGLVLLTAEGVRHEVAGRTEPADF